MGIYDTQTVNEKPQKTKNAKKPRSKKEKILTSVIAIILVVALVVTGGFFLNGKNKTTSYSFVRTTTLSKGTLEESFSATGTVKSTTTSNVTTNLSYTIKDILVVVGDEVKKGDTIVTLDTTDLEKQIEREKNNISTSKSQAQSSYDKAKKNYDKAKTSLSDAKSELNQAKKQQTTQSTVQNANADANVNAGFNSTSNATSSYDSAKQAVEQAESQLEQAEEQLEQAKIQLENAGSSDTLEELKEQLNNCNLKAGQDGTITSLNATVGSSATSGMGSSAVATISDLSSLKISITIAEANINKATIGMKCKLTSDASDETIDGTLTQIDPVAGDGGSFGAEVTVDSENTPLKVGMNASVSIIISSKDDVFQVPIDAVGNDDDGDFVYRYISGEGVDMGFEKVYVDKGDSNDYYIEIYSNELAEGDVIRSTADLTLGIETGEKKESDSSGFSLFGSGSMPGGGSMPSGMPSGEFSMPSGSRGGGNGNFTPPSGGFNG